MNSNKPNWDSVGSIKFFTNEENNISGLDEAVENISLSNKQSSSQANSTDDAQNVSSEAADNDSKPDYEIAMEATNTDYLANDNVTDSKWVADIDTNPYSMFDSRGEDNDASFDLYDVNKSNQESNFQMFLTSSSSLSYSLDNAPTSFGSEKHSSTVNVNDIHAILDSFPINSSSSTEEFHEPSQSYNPSNSLLDEFCSKHSSHSVKISPLCHESSDKNMGQTNELLLTKAERPAVLFEKDKMDDDIINHKHEFVESTASSFSGEKSMKSNVLKSETTLTNLSRRQLNEDNNNNNTSSVEKRDSNKTNANKSNNYVEPRSKNNSKQSNYLIFTFLIGSSILALICFWLFSAFIWGFLSGVLTTLLFVYSYCFLNDTPLFRKLHTTQCPISGTPLNELCCSMHYQQKHDGYFKWPVYAPAIPNINIKPVMFKDLPSFSVPNMLEEDVHKSTNFGPLGKCLGYKMDKNNRPLYKGWLNEIAQYNPETHHVNKTFSVYVTLDGTRLRIQRPERNISRRSLWSDEIPSINTIRFKSQRSFELVSARISLIPHGLVGKRLWSRKYPICITIPKRPTEKSGQKHFSTDSTNNKKLSLCDYSDNQIDDDLLIINNNLTKSNSHFDKFSLYNDDGSQILYLFGRTSREKETWYRRFQASSLGVPLVWTPQLVVQNYLINNDVTLTNETTSTIDDDENQNDCNSTGDQPNAMNLTNSSTSTFTSAVNGSATSCTNLSTATTTNSTTPSCTNNLNNNPLSGFNATTSGIREPIYVSYVRYMAKFMPANWLIRGANALKLNTNRITCENNLIWLNAFVGRVLWDVMRETLWLDRIRSKIQAKLKKIHLPNFINELTVVDIDLGNELPVIRRVGLPYLDVNGLWVEVDVAYAGGFSFTLETSVNLMRWNQKNREEMINTPDQSSTSSFDQNQGFNLRSSSKMAAFVSDEEDSVDSTTDSEQDETALFNSRNPKQSRSSMGSNFLVSTNPTSPGTKGGDSESVTNEESSLSTTAFPSHRRLIRIVDRITKSAYFQKAVDNKLVQRGMERLCNTPIVLQVEVQLLAGTLLLNIPPPPSDRVWYGFRPTPQLRLKTRPRVGEKVVTLSRILEWIEKKLILEFQHLVVMPNMDDIKIGLLLTSDV